MGILLIIPIGLYMLVFIPAFMFTWEGSVFNGIGAYGWFCMFVGFPGAVVALLLKGIVKLIKLPWELKAKKERQRRSLQLELEQRRREEEKARKEKALIEKATKKYSNSPLTKEIVEIIPQGNELPYSIELKSTGMTFYFENSTRSYVFRSHELPDMDEIEEKVFAGVLNQKFGNRYSITEETKLESFQHSDGTIVGFTKHICTKMLRKSTRTF